MSESLKKRLDLNGVKFQSLLDGLDDVVKLNDPIGKLIVERGLFQRECYFA